MNPVLESCVVFLLLVGPAAAAAPPLDGAAIERLSGAHGSWSEAEAVFKVTVPRGDLAVKVAGIDLPAAQGLTSWAAFHAAEGGEAIVMGDVVVTDVQVDAVVDEALDAGLAVTALHNHFLHEEPRVMYMHVEGHGTSDALAAAVGRVFRRERETRGSAATVAAAAPPPALDAAALAAVLGASGKSDGALVKFVWGRKATAHGVEIAGAMGVNTWATFGGSDRSGSVDGDFAVVTADELQPVLRALRRGGLEIAAIHGHMADESPRLLFVHYWATGPALELARGLRGALDAQAARR